MIEDLLRSHDGVVTRAQALDCGIGPDAVDRLVRTGKWERRGPGIYFASDRPFSHRARIRCAVWGAGLSGVGSGMTAAFWHGVTTDAPAKVEVTVPRGGRSRAMGCHLRRRNIAAKDIVERQGLRVTSLELAVLESASVAVMDRALQRHTTVSKLRRAHERNKGRTGTPRAEALLRSAEGGARSDAERLFATLLKAAKIEGWIANYRFGGFVIDFAFPNAKLAIEIDGWAFHTDHDAFRNDRRRQNDLSAHWRVLRFTWADLIEHPQETIDRVRSFL